jgi:cyclase
MPAPVTNCVMTLAHPHRRVASAFAFAVLVAPAAAAQSGLSYRVDRVADGIHAVIRTEGAGHILDGNSMFIVTDRDVIVVDATLTPESARRVISEIRRATRLPVRYVINTHFHDDHVLGNQVYAAAYPGVEIIAHPNAARDIMEFGVTARAQFLKAIPGYIEFTRKQIAAGQGFDGQPLTPAKQAILAADTLLALRFLSESPGIRSIAPTLHVPQRMTIARPGKTIDVMHFGPANTDGDLVVFVREHGVLAAGDQIGWPVPYASPTSHVTGWVRSLACIKALQPRVIIPGHGEPVRTLEPIDRLTAALESVDAQVRTAIGLLGVAAPLDSVRRRVNLANERRGFTNGEPSLDELWRSYFVAMAVQQSYAEHTGKLKTSDRTAVCGFLGSSPQDQDVGNAESGGSPVARASLH